MKKAHGGHLPKGKGQIELFLSTAAKLAAEYSVSENTVQRAWRNLSPDAFKMSLGRRYNRTKQAHGGQLPKGKGQIDLFLSTAAKLAAEHSVSEATVKRAWRRLCQRKSYRSK